MKSNHVSVRQIQILIREKYKSLPLESIERNTSFFFYGRTGSGKTYTMNEILLLLSKLSDSKYNVSLSEIYFNKMSSLGEYKNLTLLEISELVCSKRRLQSTIANAESSRSILILHLEKFGVSFIDLMGSEKSTDEIGNENNKNLICLHRCITALLEKQSHIPFRECELTKLFERELKSKKVVFIGCVDESDLKETNRTLSFLKQAERVKVVVSEKSKKAKKAKKVEEVIEEKEVEEDVGDVEESDNENEEIFNLLLVQFKELEEQLRKIIDG